ncbi:MAG TPA: glycosyltransferase family 2 protein [Chitinophagaceae bacterium]|jgi:glycosyltransferase involved in cell wall biosynthesis|nr:glycosyltransferase family 2 protein [Chitinophagaceae bacterium]
MEKISVVIITFNEENKLARCLESVKPVADEIIILDSFSTDNTVKIGLKAGAIVHQQSFHGYKEQKNAALQLASYNYVLSVDADEALSVELINSIQIAKEKFTCSAYSMNRCNFFSGRFIRYGLWYPDKKIRLFDKRLAYWGGLNPHDKIVLNENANTCHLQGDLFHYSFNSVEEYVKRNDEISSIAAKSLYKKGQRSGVKILVNPVWRFIKSYFIKKGFLDGYPGFIIAKNTAAQAYLKYRKLNKLNRERKSTLKEPVSVSLSNK